MANDKAKVNFIQMILSSFFLVLVFELIYWRFMLEKALLFLKTEVSERQEKRMRKILFDLPESVLITDRRSENILFQNEKLTSFFQQVLPHSQLPEIVGKPNES